MLKKNAAAGTQPPAHIGCELCMAQLEDCFVSQGLMDARGNQDLFEDAKSDNDVAIDIVKLSICTKCSSPWVVMGATKDQEQKIGCPKETCDAFGFVAIHNTCRWVLPRTLSCAESPPQHACCRPAV